MGSCSDTDYHSDVLLANILFPKPPSNDSRMNHQNRDVSNIARLQRESKPPEPLLVTGNNSNLPPLNTQLSINVGFKKREVKKQEKEEQKLAKEVSPVPPAAAEVK